MSSSSLRAILDNCEEAPNLQSTAIRIYQMYGYGLWRDLNHRKVSKAGVGLRMQFEASS